MPKLPVLSGREAKAAFERLGWVYKPGSGSHMVLFMPGRVDTLSIPDHKALDRGILRALIRKAGITVQEFVEALH